MDMADMCRFFWRVFLLIGVAGLLMLAAAAENLTCNVTQLPGGLFMYRLSRQPTLPSFSREWTDSNNTKIAHNCNSTPLVHNCTDDTIVLKECRDFMRHINDAEQGLEETTCTFNCSAVSAEDARPPDRPAPLTCVFGKWCLEPWTLCLVIGAIVVPAAAFGGWKLWRHKRTSAAVITAYTPVKDPIKIDIGQLNTTAAEQG